MVLTSKETDLLKDMKSQEELCIKKYNRYANEAKCSELKTLFTNMANTESNHLKTVNEMLEGKEPSAPGSLHSDNSLCKACASEYTSTEEKNHDAFLCQDMLSMEKHVSSVYNTSVFEFKSPAARRMLSHIQAEEQQHGEMLYAFMNANGMYS